MTRIEWKAEHQFDAGLDRGVIYLHDGGEGVPWNGLVSVEERGVDSGLSSVYLDGIRHLLPRPSEDFSASLSAYVYPEEFEEYEDYFDLTYRTNRGINGYQIHLLYNVTASQVYFKAKTLGEKSGLEPFTWDISSVPVDIPGGKPSAHIVIDTNFTDSMVLGLIEDMLYGGDGTYAMMPSLDEVLSVYQSFPTVIVTDNGDGSWSAEGPDEAIRIFEDGTFEIEWPSAVYISNDTYEISTS